MVAQSKYRALPSQELSPGREETAIQDMKVSYKQGKKQRGFAERQVVPHYPSIFF